MMGLFRISSSRAFSRGNKNKVRGEKRSLSLGDWDSLQEKGDLWQRVVAGWQSELVNNGFCWIRASS
jgi:hypothetical protein